jgi:hypothetical protein
MSRLTVEAIAPMSCMHHEADLQYYHGGRRHHRQHAVSELGIAIAAPMQRRSARPMHGLRYGFVQHQILNSGVD